MGGVDVSTELEDTATAVPESDSVALGVASAIKFTGDFLGNPQKLNTNPLETDPTDLDFDKGAGERGAESFLSVAVGEKAE